MLNSTEIKRLTIVLALALTGLALSFLFLRPEALDGKHERLNSLAYLLELNNDVQKKTSHDLIWHIALPGDELYVGDLIRTSKDSTALVEFQESGSKVHLSEDSTIVIDKERPEKMSLTMVRGDIFVEALSNAQKIRLETAEGSVELGEGQANLSFDKEKRLSLNVYEGQAELERSGKRTIVKKFESASSSQEGIDVSQQLFQFTSPAQREKIFVKSSRPYMKIEWSAHSQDFEYEFYRGRNPDSLVKVPVEKKMENALSVPVVNGEFYWKVVALNDEERFESELRKNDLLMVGAPQFIRPRQGHVEYMKSPGEKIQLSWHSSYQENLQLDIASDEKMQNLKESLMVDQMNSYEFEFNLEEGSYYAQLKAYVPELGEVKSQVRSFDVRFGDGLIPPKLRLPRDQSTILAENNADEKEVYFQWRAVDGVKSYELQVMRPNGEKLKEVETSDQSLKINLPPGAYLWSVRSLAEDMNKSDFSVTSRFEIQELTTLAWKEDKSEIYFNPRETQHLLKWSDLADRYIVLVRELSSGREFRYETERPSYRWSPSTPGKYEIMVEGYKKDQLRARASQRRINIIEKPLLSPPSLEQLGDKIKADGLGSLSFDFSPVPGAKYYVVDLAYQDGRIYRTEQVTGTSVEIKSLYPGFYLLGLRAFDEYNRSSRSSRKIEVEVPKESSIQAPKLKKVKVR